MQCIIKWKRIIKKETISIQYSFDHVNIILLSLLNISLIETKVIKVLREVAKTWSDAELSPFHHEIFNDDAVKKEKKFVCLRIRNEFRRLTTRQIVLFLADRNSVEEKAPRRRVCAQNDQHAPCWPAEKCSTILFPISPQRGHFGFDYLRPPGRHLRLPVNVLVPNFTASCTWLCCKRKRHRDVLRL